jgi:hypothetical protein
MRDLVAGLIAVALLIVAASLATTLQLYRRNRQRTRDAERALGRAIITEIPAGGDLVLFSEDAKRYYYGERSLDKDLVTAVRVLINGSPIAAYVSTSGRPDSRRPPLDAGERRALAVHVDDRAEGIARDRWDVAIETVTGTTLIECGAIRERVSQELARAVFDAVKRYLEDRDAERS